MIKALVVDDEPLARDELIYLLLRTKKVEVVGEADGVESVLDALNHCEIDVIFLDIQLADENGLNLAKRLLELDKCPAIVFATAYDEFALKAFELQAIDYILKPFDEKRVQKTIDKIAKLIEKNESKPHVSRKNFLPELTEKLAITVDDRIILIDTREILYFGTDEGKTVIATINQKFYVADPLVSFERKLHNSTIIRVHRAFLVNLNRIVEIQPWFHSTYNLIMEDGETVPVSRTYIKKLKTLIGF